MLSDIQNSENNFSVKFSITTKNMIFQLQLILLGDASVEALITVISLHYTTVHKWGNFTLVSLCKY